MRSRFVPFVFVCLFFASMTVAQRVNEADSTVTVSGNDAIVRLQVGSDGPTTANARLDLLDIGDVVKATASRQIKLSADLTAYEFTMHLGSLSEKELEDLPWFRLRYSIGDARGIISLSRMIRELFELRILAAENVLSGTTYRVRVRAQNPNVGEPASGVSVAVALNIDLKGDEDKALELKGAGLTDGEGFAVIDLAIPPEAQLDDDGTITVTGRKGAFLRKASEDLETVVDRLQAVSMTDKPIYQPGQMLNIRSLFLKGAASKVVASGSEAEFRIEDEDDTLLYRERTTSSEFGIASISWRIPTNVNLGNYTIRIRDANGSDISVQHVRVSRYDLPNFLVNAKATKTYYLPSDNEAEVEVSADYLFGKPVIKGKVRVVEEKSREWNWKKQKYDIDEGEVREGETDADGNFTAKFDLKEKQDDLGDSDWQKYKDITYAAYFTDLTTNKTEQRRFDVRISREPIHAYLIKGSDFGNARLPLVGYVSTFYADGTPAACDVEIKASAEDADKFKTYARVKTNALGGAKFTMPRPNIGDPDDDLDFRIVAKDKDGRHGSDDENVYFDGNDEGIRISTNRVIYKPGESVDVNIQSTIGSGTVYIDVISDWSVVDSTAVKLKDGKTSIQIPYRDAFKGQLTLAAYTEDPTDEDELVTDTRGIIFPARQSIKVDAAFDKAVYKPNEEATVDFGILDAAGRAVESALGVVVFDKAVEERARADADFGGMFSDLSGWLGYGNGFGSINVKDLNELDLNKPISGDLQTVAEIILLGGYYDPNVFHSEHYDDTAASAYSPRIGNQFSRVRASLSYEYLNHNAVHPVDDASLRHILSEHGIDPTAMLDPWGTRFKPEFDIDKTRDIVRFRTAGPDKVFYTKDDFTAFSGNYEYFTPMAKIIDSTVKNHFARTGEPIRDGKTLYAKLGVADIRDRWGHPYKIVSEGDGKNIRLMVISSGPDGKDDGISNYGSVYGDDFIVSTSSVDFFAPQERKIRQIQAVLKRAPLTEGDFKKTLEKGGVDFDKLRDGNGNPLYINVSKRSRYWDKVTIEDVLVYGSTARTERSKITPVTQQIVEFTIRGNGRDGKPGTSDDVTFMQVVHVLAEQTKVDLKPVPVQPTAYSGNSGAIAGTVVDMQGAIVPGATVTATDPVRGISRDTSTNDNGTFLIGNLPPGTYSVKAEASAFQTSVIDRVSVTVGTTVSLKIVMNVGIVTETVDVSAENSYQVETSASAISQNVTSSTVMQLPINARNAMSLVGLRPGAVKAVTRSGTDDDASATDEPNSTPRLREYFPETLLWQPQIATDPNGKAEIKFRMADNITTWKMYTIASTKTGKVGFAEKEVTAFKAFFADLDPPKFLTTGDEIYLPTQVRNYTDKKQAVTLTMARSDWFQFLGCDPASCDAGGMKRTASVNSGETANTVFGFKAIEAINEGRQRITAIGQTDSDAIERPVTVRPNGREIVTTESRYSMGSEHFDINFPANALPEVRSAELKIYPNLMAHVVESVEGLLERPYGCGEQTISSTYPNLMILKFAGGSEGHPRRIDATTERKAKKYLLAGYERLVGYQSADGGFSYWGGKDTSDLALTAYAIRFLSDAAAYIEIDPTVADRAGTWLASQQRADGSWNKKYIWEAVENPVRAKMTTTYVARTLAMIAARPSLAPGQGTPETPKTFLGEPLKNALSYLAARNAEIDDPYSLALLGLAAFDSGNRDLANEVAGRLAILAKDESGAAYWNLESNTAFNGWGSAGRTETTALVIQLFLKLHIQNDLVRKAMLFLLKNKDRYGVWYSTQTTINVLDAFVATIAADDRSALKTVDVLVNGKRVRKISIGPDSIGQIVVDLTDNVTSDTNDIEIQSEDSSPIIAQVVESHYIGWPDADTSGRNVNSSGALKLEYACDHSKAAIMQEITCSVSAERIGYRGYGMLLAEIGTPPGADVSRESLENAKESNWEISRYEILPDRIRLYMWSAAGGTKFSFKFRPRYGINAQTPPSTVYDYYNPEAQGTVAPLKFLVK